MKVFGSHGRLDGVDQSKAIPKGEQGLFQETEHLTMCASVRRTLRLSASSLCAQTNQGEDKHSAYPVRGWSCVSLLVGQELL